MLVISAIKYPNSKIYHTVLKLLNIFQGWLFTVSILKFLCYVIRVDRGTAEHVKYKQSSLCSVDARKATSLGCFCNSCTSECNLWGVSEVRRHLWLLLHPCVLKYCYTTTHSLKWAFAVAWAIPQYYMEVMGVH